MHRWIVPFVLLFLLTGCSELRLGAEAFKGGMGRGTSTGAYKVGKPYQAGGEWYYPQESFSYDETGIASWYGPGFHGKRTANGESYNQREMTAAHPTLQMPSFVRVTNLENGKSVVVRINDRGPYARGRIIDVSERAADLLGFKGKGTALVRVTVLAEESRKVAAAAREGRRWHGGDFPAPTSTTMAGLPERSPVMAQPLPPTGEQLPVENGQFVPVHVRGEKVYPDPVVAAVAVPATHNIYVQAGAFADAGNAERLAARLGSVGPAQVSSVVLGGQTFHRVRIPARNVPEADRLLRLTLGAGAQGARIVVD